MNKIKEFLLKIIAGLGLILSTIFYVLFRLKKDQIQEQKQEQQKKEINELSENLEVINKINKKQVEEKKTHAELYNEALRDVGNNNSADVPGAELLQKLREEGKQRNN